ncbi:hypothetical protein HPP92_025267 [Vanilla planifolia]|uniref:Uncharacterized protein n=1 Tax=Vanilla planifolia TaxID=51239 RepID=A0A835PMC9_VANPL|nr:hypothetical protein HPP92_025267 [Vanilla planifolia]
MARAKGMASAARPTTGRRQHRSRRCEDSAAEKGAKVAQPRVPGRRRQRR